MEKVGNEFDALPGALLNGLRKDAESAFLGACAKHGIDVAELKREKERLDRLAQELPPNELERFHSVLNDLEMAGLVRFAGFEDGLADWRAVQIIAKSCLAGDKAVENAKDSLKAAARVYLGGKGLEADEVERILAEAGAGWINPKQGRIEEALELVGRGSTPAMQIILSLLGGGLVLLIVRYVGGGIYAAGAAGLAAFCLVAVIMQKRHKPLNSFQKMCAVFRWIYMNQWARLGTNIQNFSRAIEEAALR